jgi:hypothetical protein
MNTTPHNVIPRRFVTAKFYSTFFVHHLPRVSLHSASFPRRSREFTARCPIVFNQ